MFKRLLAIIVLALVVGLGVVGSAAATHCYVADKPAGAGTGTGTQGAFMSEDGTDVFMWDLPEPAHDNGSPTHGILELEE
jgi:hypothetical protein